MKYPIVACAFFLIKCQPAPMHPNDPEQKKPSEIAEYEVLHGDTINRRDRLGRKQGLWISFVKGKSTDTVFYKNDEIITR